VARLPDAGFPAAIRSRSSSRRRAWRLATALFGPGGHVRLNSAARARCSKAPTDKTRSRPAVSARLSWSRWLSSCQPSRIGTRRSGGLANRRARRRAPTRRARADARTRGLRRRRTNAARARMPSLARYWRSSAHGRIRGQDRQVHGHDEPHPLEEPLLVVPQVTDHSVGAQLFGAGRARRAARRDAPRRSARQAWSDPGRRSSRGRRVPSILGILSPRRSS
jgi:hypothetical protein